MNKRSVLKVSVFAALLLGSGAALASVTAGVTITEVRVDRTGLGFITLSANTAGSPPACGNGYPSSLAFDTNTSGGRTLFSAALAAKLSGRPVYVVGTGACALYGVIEELDLLVVR